MIDPKALQKAKQQLADAETPMEQMFYSVLVDVLNRTCLNAQDALKITRSICEARLAASGNLQT